MTRRRCLGVMTCANENCQVITRPGTKKIVQGRQIFNGCSGCGAALVHHPCGAVATLYTWRGGVHHDHAVLPHQLHLLKSEKADLTRIMRSNPKVGVASLVNGAPGRPSVADINVLLLNPD